MFFDRALDAIAACLGMERYEYCDALDADPRALADKLEATT